MNDSWEIAESLSNLIQEEGTGFAYHNFPQFVWWDKPVVLTGSRAKVMTATEVVNPVVTIEKEKMQSCRPLTQQSKSPVSGANFSYPESDASSLNFVTVVDSVSDNSQRSHSVWMVPANMDLNQSVRFCVSTPYGKTIHSEPFQVSDVLDGTKDPVIPRDGTNMTSKP